MNQDERNTKNIQVFEQIGIDMKSKANDSEVVKQVNKSDGTALEKVNGVVTLPETTNAEYYSQKFTYSDSKIFTLTHNFYVVTNVEAQTTNLIEGEHYNLLNPNQVEITRNLTVGDVIVIKYWVNSAPSIKAPVFEYIKKFYAPPMQDSFNVASDTSWLIDYTQLIQKWDDIITNNPTNPALTPYISKAEIGRSGAGNLPIYRYDFKPPNPTHKVLVTAGTHAHEKMYLKEMYEFFDLLCTTWQNDPILEWLRWNVEFVVIPCRSPYTLSWWGRAFGSRTIPETEPIPVTWTKSGADVTITFDAANFPAIHLDGATYFTAATGLEGKSGIGIITSSDTTALNTDAYRIKTVVNGTTIIVEAPDTLGGASGTGELQVWTDPNRNWTNGGTVWSNFTPSTNIQGTDGGQIYGYYEEKGTQPLSLKENQVLVALIDAENFDFVIDGHAPAKDHYLSWSSNAEPNNLSAAIENIKNYSGQFVMSDFSKLKASPNGYPYPDTYYGVRDQPFFIMEWGSGLHEATSQQATDALRWFTTCLTELLRLR